MYTKCTLSVHLVYIMWTLSEQKSIFQKSIFSNNKLLFCNQVSLICIKCVKKLLKSVDFLMKIDGQNQVYIL